MKKFIAIMLIVLTSSMVGCANEESFVEEYPTSNVIPAEGGTEFYISREVPWEDTVELELPEFPGVTFIRSATGVKAIDQSGERLLFGGMPIWNIYFMDITGNGLPDFVATVSIGSGIVDTRVIVYDFANDKRYELSNRMVYDYALAMDDGTLIVIQTPWLIDGEQRIGELAIMEGELIMVDRMVN